MGHFIPVKVYTPPVPAEENLNLRCVQACRARPQASVGEKESSYYCILTPLG